MFRKVQLSSFVNPFMFLMSMGMCFVCSFNGFTVLVSIEQTHSTKYHLSKQLLNSDSTKRKLEIKGSSRMITSKSEDGNQSVDYSSTKPESEGRKKQKRSQKLTLHLPRKAHIFQVFLLNWQWKCLLLLRIK